MGSEWGAAAIGALITAVLTGFGALLVRWYRALGVYKNDSAKAKVTLSEDERKTKREDEAAERKQESAILKEYKALVVQQRGELAENRQLIHDLRDKMQEMTNELASCEIGRARADERIGALEQALDDAGIAHRKWLPGSTGDGSGSHPKLPESDK